MPQSKPSLTKAKAVLREQWPEVIQHLGDYPVLTEHCNQSKLRNRHYSSAIFGKSDPIT